MDSMDSPNFPQSLETPTDASFSLFDEIRHLLSDVALSMFNDGKLINSDSLSQFITEMEKNPGMLLHSMKNHQMSLYQYISSFFKRPTFSENSDYQTILNHMRCLLDFFKFQQHPSQDNTLQLLESIQWLKKRDQFPLDLTLFFGTSIEHLYMYFEHLHPILKNSGTFKISHLLCEFFKHHSSDDLRHFSDFFIQCIQDNPDNAVVSDDLRLSVILQLVTNSSLHPLFKAHFLSFSRDSQIEKLFNHFLSDSIDILQHFVYQNENTENTENASFCQESIRFFMNKKPRFIIHFLACVHSDSEIDKFFSFLEYFLTDSVFLEKLASSSLLNQVYSGASKQIHTLLDKYTNYDSCSQQYVVQILKQIYDESTEKKEHTKKRPMTVSLDFKNFHNFCSNLPKEIQCFNDPFHLSDLELFYQTKKQEALYHQFQIKYETGLCSQFVTKDKEHLTNIVMRYGSSTENVCVIWKNDLYFVLFNTHKQALLLVEIVTSLTVWEKQFSQILHFSLSDTNLWIMESNSTIWGIELPSGNTQCVSCADLPVFQSVVYFHAFQDKLYFVTKTDIHRLHVETLSFYPSRLSCSSLPFQTLTKSTKTRSLRSSSTSSSSTSSTNTSLFSFPLNILTPKTDLYSFVAQDNVAFVFLKTKVSLSNVYAINLDNFNYQELSKFVLTCPKMKLLDACEIEIHFKICQKPGLETFAFLLISLKEKSSNNKNTIQLFKFAKNDLYELKNLTSKLSAPMKFEFDNAWIWNSNYLCIVYYSKEGYNVSNIMSYDMHSGLIRPIYFSSLRAFNRFFMSDYQDTVYFIGMPDTPDSIEKCFLFSSDLGPYDNSQITKVCEMSKDSQFLMISRDNSSDKSQANGILYIC